MAVITGAASGIGKALAMKCLKLGIKVVLADNNQNKLKQCKDELKNFNNKILICQTDVSKEIEIIQLANLTIEKFGSVHFLFNNAGIPGALGPIWTQSTTDIEEVIQVNLMGTIYGIKTFIPIMLKQNDNCYVINTSAGAGLLTGAGLSAYKASKHAIVAVSEVLYADLKAIHASIHVSVLIPHWVNTDIAKNIKTDDKKIINDSIERLINFGMPAETVAEKVFDAIKNRQFYIFTHANEHLPKIKKRMETILSIGNPC